MKTNLSIRPWAAAFWLIVWQLVSMAINQRILLVSPLSVLLRLAQLAVTSGFWSAIGFSMLRIVFGFTTACLTGIIFAALSVRFRRVRELLAPLMLSVKTIPVASFIILALVWFSSKNLSMLISFLMVLPVIYTNVLSGIESADKGLREMAQVFQLSAGRRIRYIYIPQVYPFFKSACDSALGLCWKAGIAAEVIGMPVGSIGEKLQQAKVYLNTPDMFAWTLVIVLISLTFERVFLFALTKVEKALEAM